MFIGEKKNLTVTCPYQNYVVKVKEVNVVIIKKIKIHQNKIY